MPKYCLKLEVLEMINYSIQIISEYLVCLKFPLLLKVPKFDMIYVIVFF